MTADRVIAAGAIALAALYLHATSGIAVLEIGDPLGPRAFPRLLGVALIGAAVLLVLETFRGGKESARKAQAASERDAHEARNPSDDAARARDGGWRRFATAALVVVWTGCYFAAFERAGYILATAIFLLVALAYFHRGRWLVNVLVAALFPLLSYALFVKGLNVGLAKGVLFF